MTSTSAEVAVLQVEVKSLQDDCRDHESRLRLLEDKKNWAAGVIAAALFLWPIIWHFISKTKGW